MVGKRTLMASLKRFPDSRYWFAVFIGPNGKQRCCSTKEVERRRAQKIADRFKQTVATEIKPVTTFTPAEDYHQDYHDKNPVSYKFYKWRCGRAQRLEEIWGPPQKPS